MQDENGSIKIQDESFININDKNNKSTNEEINTLQGIYVIYLHINICI